MEFLNDLYLSELSEACAHKALEEDYEFDEVDSSDDESTWSKSFDSSTIWSLTSTEKAAFGKFSLSGSRFGSGLVSPVSSSDAETDDSGCCSDEELTDNDYQVIERTCRADFQPQPPPLPVLLFLGQAANAALRRANAKHSSCAVPTRPALTDSKSTKFCSLCAKNGQSPYGHNLKDERGNVACPILRRFICPLCGASGDNAHTRSHCPMKRTGQSVSSCGIARRSVFGASM